MEEPPPLRLKCLVLGSAGAGKTSLLRRFVRGAFEGGPRGDRAPRGGEFHELSERRSTPSTLGADYYVKRVANPLFQKGCGDDGAENDGGAGKREEGKPRAPRHDDSLQNNTNDNKHNTPNPALAPYVTVQLWDTAGRERRAPRRPPARYDRHSNFYQFLSVRPSKRSGGGRYEHRYNNWGIDGDPRRKEKDRGQTNAGNGNGSHRHGHPKRNTTIKHGRPLHYRNNNPKPSQAHSNRPPGDALFRHIDACLLVYDATSAASFLHLMEWHAEVTKKLERWEKEAEDGNGKNGTASEGVKRKCIPFMVVANKLDLLEGDCGNDDSSVPSAPTTERGERRSVLGLHGSYTGSEMRYDYTADASAPTDDPSNNDNALPGDKSTAPPHASNARHPPKPLTYSLRETLWSTDAAYVAALQRTEDRLPANRRMILRWCERHGIPHAETSALDGRGVGEAMARLVRMGVEGQRRAARDEREEGERRMGVEGMLGDAAGCDAARFDAEEKAHTESSEAAGGAELEHRTLAQHDVAADGIGATERAADPNAASPSQYYFLYKPRRDDELDLFARYSAAEEERCSPFACWTSWFARCRR
ncbi:hypothetical protein ACHAXT_001671 [Thalassiosira profunda]